MEREAIAAAPSCVLVTGLQAAGKSTIGRALAERSARGAFVEGDLFARMIVTGRAEMSRRPSPEARRQLRLRYDLATQTAVALREAGFVVVHSDIILGDELRAYAEAGAPGELRIVVLVPDVETIAVRERDRPKTAYGRYGGPGEALEDVIRGHLAWIEETPPLGIRVDSSGQTVDETVDEILDRWDEARVS